jgi:hypothetical protein
MKLTRSTMFKHATLRYSSGDRVICRVSTVRKGLVYWQTWDLKPNSDFDLSDDVYKTDQSIIGEIITWVEARKYLENAQR